MNHDEFQRYVSYAVRIKLSTFERRPTSDIDVKDWTRSTLTDPWFVVLYECSAFDTKSEYEDLDDIRRKSQDMQQSEWNKQRRDCISYTFSRGTSQSEEILTMKDERLKYERQRKYVAFEFHSISDSQGE